MCINNKKEASVSLCKSNELSVSETDIGRKFGLLKNFGDEETPMLNTYTLPSLLFRPTSNRSYTNIPRVLPCIDKERVFSGKKDKV